MQTGVLYLDWGYLCGLELFMRTGFICNGRISLMSSELLIEGEGDIYGYIC